MIPILDLRRQYAALEEDMRRVFQDVASSGRYILGPQVEAFEREFASYIGVKHAIGVGNGTDALRIGLGALGVGPGQEVITTPFTFAATLEAIIQTGARPVLVDIDPQTLNIDPTLVEKAITPRTRAILPVHLYGQVADTDALGDLCQRHDLVMLEDAAQAAGASRGGVKAGALGTAAIFSFYPTKNLSCMGDGGIITTNEDGVAERARLLRVHGSPSKYEHKEIGFNSRLDEIQAAILRLKLPRLDSWNQRRGEIASFYNRELSGLVDTPHRDENCLHIYHQYTIMTDRRDALREHLNKRGIGTAVHYPKPLHLQEAFSGLGYKKGDFPVAERASERVLSLPVFPELMQDEARQVADAVKEFFAS